MVLPPGLGRAFFLLPLLLHTVEGQTSSCIGCIASSEEYDAGDIKSLTKTLFGLFTAFGPGGAGGNRMPEQVRAIRTALNDTLHWRRCLPLYFAGMVDVFEQCKLQHEFIRKVAEPLFDIVQNLVSGEFLCEAVSPLCPSAPLKHLRKYTGSTLLYSAAANSSSMCAFCDLQLEGDSPQPREKPQLAGLRQAGTSLCEMTKTDLKIRQECNTHVHTLSTLLEELDWRTGWRKVHASTCRTKINCGETRLPNKCYNPATDMRKWVECSNVECTVSGWAQINIF